MNWKFIVYALAVTVLTTTVSWGKFLAGSTGTGSNRSSAWSSNTGTGSWGSSGSHK